MRSTQFSDKTQVFSINPEIGTAQGTLNPISCEVSERVCGWVSKKGTKTDAASDGLAYVKWKWAIMQKGGISKVRLGSIVPACTPRVVVNIQALVTY